MMPNGNLIPVHLILPNPQQPRETFDADELQTLANSIRQRGLIQAITVEPADDGRHYIIQDGERRWRAARMAGLAEIPAMIAAPISAADAPHERLIRAMVANLVRADLNPVEEGAAYQRLIDEGLTMVQIADQCGVSLGRVTNRLRIQQLEPEIQQLIANGTLVKDLRAVDALLTVPTGQTRIKLAETLARNRSSVNAVQTACHNLVARLQVVDQRRGASPIDVPPAIRMAQPKAADPTAPSPRWDMLAQSGLVPPWKIVVSQSDATCRSCGLYSMASNESCKQCPAIELIRRMIDAAER